MFNHIGHRSKFANTPVSITTITITTTSDHGHPGPADHRPCIHHMDLAVGEEGTCFTVSRGGQPIQPQAMVISFEFRSTTFFSSVAVMPSLVLSSSLVFSSARGLSRAFAFMNGQ